MKISGLILAAGKSSRMGSPKALVKYRGLSFLEQAAKALHNSDRLHEIRVVTGAFGDEVEEECRRLSLSFVRNDRYEEGLMTSLQCGLHSLDPTCDAALIHLIDQPLIKADLISALLDSFLEARKSSPWTLGRPMYENVPGHPCLIERSHFFEIFAQEAFDQGAAFLFQKYPFWRHQVLTTQAITDFDTPDFVDTEAI